MNYKTPKINKKTLFVFSDPGGAKPLLSLIDECHLIDVLIISNRYYSFYKDFKASVTILNQNIDTIIDDFQPQLIFTATSYTSDLEKRFIKKSIERGIKCFSFVDHWTNILKRFENTNGDLILPNKIWLIDERAKQIAIDQGIDEKRIIISGNPYHDWLIKWKPNMSKSEFIKIADLSSINNFILVFAPDPLSNINGMLKFGFDEYSALSILIEFFKINSNELKDWTVLIKAHPNQNRDEINKLILLNTSFHLLSENIDTNATLFYANIVMGFFSSILIEADIMNKKVLRFINNKLKYDPILELNIGTIVDTNGLLKELKNI
jgi:hypothetical protein